MWKGSKEKREQLEDEMDWNKLARFYFTSDFISKLSSDSALTKSFHFSINLIFCQAAAAILGHHEGTMGPVGTHIE